MKFKSKVSEVLLKGDIQSWLQVDTKRLIMNCLKSTNRYTHAVSWTISKTKKDRFLVWNIYIKFFSVLLLAFQRLGFYTVIFSLSITFTRIKTSCKWYMWLNLDINCSLSYFRVVEIRENENRRSDISNFENDVKIAKSSTSNIEQFCVFLQPFSTLLF